MTTPEHALAFPVAPVLSAYWVQPGLLAGAYPGVRHNAPLSRERIDRLIEAGTDRFLDLTEEGEREPYLALAQELAAARGRKVRHERLPVQDYQTPNRETMRRMLDRLDDALASRQTVYVHCWGGIGRTGTIIGCHLARHGMDGAAALREIARLRRRALCGEMPSPETDEQRAFVQAWRTGT